MSIGAIITVPAPSGVAASPADGNAQLFGVPIALWDVMGRSVRDRTIDALRAGGVQHIHVIAESPVQGDSDSAFPSMSQSEGFWNKWEKLTSELLGKGITHLMLLRAGPYIELDLPDLLGFHAQRPSSVTSVHDAKGSLDMLLLSAESLRQGDSRRSQLSTTLQGRRRFRVNGYTNRLSNPEELRGLIKDALWQRCGLKPRGREIEAGVWIGNDVQVDRSARITGPVYLGDSVRAGADCSITNASAVERGSFVDFGTTVNDSSVLPNTYLGAGLSVSNCVAGPARLYHLQRGVELQVTDGKLIGSASRLRMSDRSKSCLLADGAAEGLVPSMSTRSLPFASFMPKSWRLTHAMFGARSRRDGVSLISSSRYAPWEKL
ncbi:MAG: hypothetical protein H0X25_01130 [Acidobacteriales bacterium]|nr:hypothetical protein [Terriglobales bacterium]